MIVARWSLRCPDLLQHNLHRIKHRLFASSAAVLSSVLSVAVSSLCSAFKQSLLQCSQLLSLWFLLPVRPPTIALQSWKRSEPLPVIFHLSSPLSPGRFRPMENHFGLKHSYYSRNVRKINPSFCFLQLSRPHTKESTPRLANH